jgi:DNA-binding XRE family transcriptional regulator
MGAKRWDSAERERLVKLYRASSLSMAKFAAREGVAESTIYRWVSEKPLSKLPIAFARVIRRPVVPQGHTTAICPSAGVVVVEYGAVRLQLAPGFDRTTLAGVLDVLESRGNTRAS